MGRRSSEGTVLAPAGPASTVPVFMYHAITEVPAGPMRSFAVPPDLLAEQLYALAAAGYQLIGVSEAERRITARGSSGQTEGSGAGGGDRFAVLTFDDGFADFLHAAMPVLAELGASATLYPAVGYLGREAGWLGPDASAFGPLLSWSELAEVADAGIEIGNHSLRHYPLDVIPASQLWDEVHTSREELEQKLGGAVRSFCYPYGYNDRAARAAAALAGHEHACAVGYRLFRPDDDRMAIPRLHPTPDHTGPDLVTLAATGGSPLVAKARRAAEPVWRMTRRTAARFGHTLT